MLYFDGPPPCPVNCTVTLEVRDFFGESDSETVNVTVMDTTPPELSCYFEPLYSKDDEDSDEGEVSVRLPSRAWGYRHGGGGRVFEPPGYPEREQESEPGR